MHTDNALLRTKQFYDAYGQAYDRQTSAFHEVIAYPRFLDCLKRAGPLIGIRILDLGCGSGRFVRLLGEQGADAHGIEVSGEQVQASQTPHVIEGAMESLPYLEQWFDTLVSYHSVNYLPPEALMSAIEEQRRVLKPGGCVYHACMPPESSVTKLALEKGLPITPYTEAELRDLFAGHGFEAVSFHEWYAPHGLLHHIAPETDNDGRKMLELFYAEPYALLLTALRP
jgi:SAM-dependent methyltransferase